MNKRVSKMELMVIMASRLLQNNTTIFVGVSLPMLAAALAQKLHAPRMVMIFEGGSIGPEVVPEFMPYSTQEIRLTRRAFMLPSILEVFAFTQRGFVDYGIIGGAQVDVYGNVNSSIISRGEMKVRLPGSGGANAISSLAKRVIVLISHDKKRLVNKVDFITSPGNRIRSHRRYDQGLLFGEVWKVVTDLAVLGFDENDEMFLETMYPGVSVDEVSNNTGFNLIIPSNLKTANPPTLEEIQTLRRLDPKRVYLR